MDAVVCPIFTIQPSIFCQWRQVQHQIESREEVEEVISKLTEELCKETDFSDNSIVITIEAPDVPDLTLIDLPGLRNNYHKSEC